MSIEVTGGAGGLQVNLSELASASSLLAQWAEDVSGLLEHVAAAGADPDLLATASLSPATAARAEAKLAAASGPWGLAGDVTGLLALAATTRSAVLAYESGEAAVLAGIEAGQDAAMLVLGKHAVPLAVLGTGLHHAGVDVGAVADALVFDVPWAADLAGGAEGLVAGLALDPVIGPLLAAAGLDDAERLPASYEQALAALAAAGSRVGVLRESQAVRVTREPRSQEGTAQAPSSLVTFVADLDALSDSASYPARVRVLELPQPDGRSAWVVEVPGTQEWQLRAGSNPFDLTADLHQMAQGTTAAALGIERALAAARLEARNQTGRDTTSEPVMLVGYSLGGIIAAGLAADVGFQQRHHVTHVVTFGAPVARIPVPDNVSALSLEHRQDPVPRLEGQANPGGRNWVTVTRDVTGDRAAAGRGSGAHAAWVYAATAAEADVSPDPSLQQWRKESASFFARADGADPIIRDYRIERIQR